MIPGMNKAIKEEDLNEDSFKHVEAIILSMTPREREHPEILNGYRKKRIAMGSGRSVQEVNQLLKQLMEMRKVMKSMSNKGGKIRRMAGARGFFG